MLRRHLVVFATTMLLIAGACGNAGAKMGTDAGASPAVQYVEAILGAVDHIEENLPLIIETAEQAADHLMAGGNLYAIGELPYGFGLANEAIYRSGGMMMISQYRSIGEETTWREHDVLLFGTLSQTAQYGPGFRAAREAGTLAVLFGSGESPYTEDAEVLISNGFSLGTGPVVTVEGWSEPICPGGPVGNITAMWTFTGELVAACTRRGKMPTMYLSALLPGGMDRIEQYERYAFHEDMEIAPVPPGQLGRAYLAEIRRCLQGMRDHQIPAFREAGRKIANVIHAGHKAWALAVGHHLPYQFGMPGDPGILPSAATNPTSFLEIVGPDDGVVYIGYYDFPDFWWDEGLWDAGIPIILVTGGRETKPVTPRPGEIHIDSYWEHGDACVEIPGYDIKILPPSGVIQTAALWMIIGEIAGVPMIGSAAMTPEISVAGQPTRLEIAVELDIPTEDIESVRQVSVDLSSLGMSSDLLLEYIGERRYTGSTITMPPETGKHTLPIEVVMETAERDEYSYLHVTLGVYPVEDLVIYEDGPGDGWAVEVNRAESDPTSTAFVRNGSSSHAILLQPSGIFPGSVRYVFDDPAGLNVFGYTHLEFHINGGEASGQDPQVGGKTLSEWGIAVESGTWTLVSIPVSALSLTEGRLTSVAISGTVKETFYIDDMKLVAQEPPEEPTAVEALQGWAVPFGYALSQNYPNPFNPETTIRYDLPEAEMVRLFLYNLTGQRVRTLVDGERPAGTYSATWDGTDDTGRDVASGVYLCRMETEEYRAVRKLVLIR